MVYDSAPTDCRLCGRGEETMGHLWLECEALEVGRRSSDLGEALGELTSKPRKSIALFRTILRRLEDTSSRQTNKHQQHNDITASIGGNLAGEALMNGAVLMNGVFSANGTRYDCTCS